MVTDVFLNRTAKISMATSTISKILSNEAPTNTPMIPPIFDTRSKISNFGLSMYSV